MFLIFINDIGVNLHPTTIASLFADDTAIGKQGSQHDELKKLMQEEVLKILDWADRWKMKIDKDETKAMVISSSNADTNWDIELMAEDAVIETVKDYKFLGITIDNGLRFNIHIKRVIEKCRNRVNIIKCMLWKDWGNSLEVQRTLYLQFARSCIECASSSWAPWISDTGLAKLQRVQNEALRSVAGLTKTCHIDFLHLEANIEPLKNRFANIDEILYDKYARVPPSDGRRQLLDKEVTPRLKTRHGWRFETLVRVDNSIKRDISTPLTPPWRNLSQLEVQYVKLEKKKSDYQPEQLKQITMEKIHSTRANLTIYTDGSTSGAQVNGGAGVTIRDNNDNLIEESSHPAGELCSSYTGECVAFLEALKWIRANEVPDHETVLICSDSMSLAQSLDNNRWKDTDPWIKQIKDKLHEIPPKIILLWIPSHCDVEGNERADELARLGTEMNQSDTIITHKIVRAKIMNQKWIVENEKAQAIYQNRRGPKFEVEKMWPKRVRSKFAQMRSGHSMELRYYRNKIELDDSASCPNGCGVDETITHVLCECVSTSDARRRFWSDTVTPSMMTSHPDTCRKILASKYGDLRLPAKKVANNETEHSSMNEVNRSGVLEPSVRAPVALA